MPTASMACMGASPRARGKLAVDGRDGIKPGCIPACAGETFLVQLLSLFLKVHPRVRGGNIA